MGRSWILLAVAACCLQLAAAQTVILPSAPIAPSIWPQPYLLELDASQPNGGPTLYVDPDHFSVTWDANCADRDPLKTQATILDQKLFPISVQPKQDKSLGRLTGLSIHVDCPQCPFIIDFNATSSTETYNLTITHNVDGSALAHLYAPTSFGAIWGIESFVQLLTFSGGNYLLYNSSVSVYDVPRFQYRGVLVDTSRHFLPLRALRQILDGMSANKLNVMHWQQRSAVATSIASLAFPELTSPPVNGASGSGGSFDSTQATYTQEQVYTLVEYAKNRGIHIIIENGGLEQAASIGASHPELLACPELLSQGYPSIENIALDPLNNATFDFLAAYWHELDQSSTDYVHLGGDMVNYAACWATNPRIKALVDSGNHTYESIQAEFIEKVWTGIMLQKAPTTGEASIFPLFTNDQSMMYRASSASWPSAFPPTSFNTTGFQDVLFEAKDQEVLVALTEAQYDVIFSGDAWDLTSATTIAKNPAVGLLDVFDDWIDIYTTNIMEDVDPINVNFVLGGQVQLFTYQQDETSIHSTLWPRGSAAAERLWSPANFTSVVPGNHTLWRIQSFICAMQRRSLRVSPLRPGFCSTRLRVKPDTSNHITLTLVLFGFLVAFAIIGVLYCLAVVVRTISHLRAGTKAAVTASLNAPLMEH